MTSGKVETPPTSVKEMTALLLAACSGALDQLSSVEARFGRSKLTTRMSCTILNTGLGKSGIRGSAGWRAVANLISFGSRDMD